MVTALESLFPGLIGTSYQATSPATDVYNCIAWAAGCDTEWCWPMEVPGVSWPAGVPNDESMAAFEAMFSTLGYFPCADAELEREFEKIAIFADADGVPTHAARQLATGRWTSKLGKLEDIEHDLLALTGFEYGTVARIMKRPRST